MANAIYPESVDAAWSGNIDLTTDTIKVYLVDLADYTYSAAHSVLADLPAAARVASATVTFSSLAAGVVDVADFNLPSVTGDESEALVFTVDNGSSEYLWLYFDTGVTNLPIIPNGGDIGGTINGAGLVALV